MTFLRSVTRTHMVTLRTVVVVAAIVVVAILATAVFSGAGAASFDITPDPMLPAWHW